MSLRTCSNCREGKPLEEYALRSKKSGTRQWMCKTCSAEYKRAWYLRNRVDHLAKVRVLRERASAENRLRFWAFLLRQRCADCGETDPVVLELDHLRDKRNNVSAMVSSGFSWESIEAEIAKCEVRCANCHRRRTARVRGSYRLTNGILVRDVHESQSSYVA